MCQYKNIYTGFYKYLKEKKYKRKNKKKKNIVSIVATVPLEQTKSTIAFNIHLTSVTTFS